MTALDIAYEDPSSIYELLAGRPLTPRAHGLVHVSVCSEVELDRIVSRAVGQGAEIILPKTGLGREVMVIVRDADGRRVALHAT